MTYQEFQAKGYLLTEKEVRALETQILASYNAALENINKEIAALYAKMATLKPDDYYNFAIQYDRLGKLKNKILEIYTQYDKQALAIHSESVRLAMTNQYYRELYTLQWAEPIDFTVLDPNLVNYAITGEQETWKKIAAKYGSASDYVPAAGTLSSLIVKDRAATLEAIYAQINAGLINGESYAKIAKRISTIIGEELNGEVSGQLAKALRIARTEGHRAQNMGELASAYEAEAQGVQVVRMWDATLDNRVRPEHAEADGKKVAINEPFFVGGEELQFPGDPSGRPSNTINCRCHAITLAGDFMPTARRGRDPSSGETSVFSYKRFDEWAESVGLVKNRYGRLYKKA